MPADPLHLLPCPESPAHGTPTGAGENKVRHWSKCICDGTGYRFPMLGRNCPWYDAVAHWIMGKGLTLPATAGRQVGCRDGQDECKGTGRIANYTTETLLEAVQSLVKEEREMVHNYLAESDLLPNQLDWDDTEQDCLVWWFALSEAERLDALKAALEKALKETDE